MDRSHAPIIPDDLGPCAAAAMAEIRIALSRLRPVERRLLACCGSPPSRAFWNSDEREGNLVDPIRRRAGSSSPASFEARVAAKQRFCAARGLKATLRKSLRPTGLLRMLRVLQDMNVVLPAAIEATPKEPYRAD
jgi:hypothetical protein